MSLSVLSEKAIYPDEDLVKLHLRGGYVFWSGLKEHIAAAYKKASEEWKHYGKAAGWTLAVLSGKRRLLNLIPMDGYFTACFVFGEKAGKAVFDSNLPEQVKKLMPDEKACMCGFDFRLDIKNGKDLEAAKKLLEIKAEN